MSADYWQGESWVMTPTYPQVMRNLQETALFWWMHVEPEIASKFLLTKD